MGHLRTGPTSRASCWGELVSIGVTAAPSGQAAARPTEPAPTAPGSLAIRLGRDRCRRGRPTQPPSSSPGRQVRQHRRRRCSSGRSGRHGDRAAQVQGRQGRSHPSRHGRPPIGSLRADRGPQPAPPPGLHRGSRNPAASRRAFTDTSGQNRRRPPTSTNGSGPLRHAAGHPHPGPAGSYLERESAELARAIKPLIEAVAPGLLEVFGVGYDVAARGVRE
jgi:hypothetical protein